MLQLVSPLMHGEVGFWDEILCLIPSLILVSLIVYIAWLERRRRRSADAPGEQALDDDDV